MTPRLSRPCSRSSSHGSPASLRGTRLSVPALTEEWELSELGLKIRDPDLSIERFTDLCWQLGRFHEAVRFAIGDAIIQGEMLYGESAYQAIEEMNLSEDARQEYVRVAQRVPPSRRRKGLSWSHHRAVAALEPAQQKEMLKRCVDEGLSHHALRDELRNGAETQVLSHCRCCGREL